VQLTKVQRNRAIWAGALVGAALAHVGVLVWLKPEARLRFVDDASESLPPMEVFLVERRRPSPAAGARADAARAPEDEDEFRAPAPSDLPPIESLGPAPSASPAAAAPGVIPSGPGVTVADPFARRGVTVADCSNRNLLSRAEEAECDRLFAGPALPMKRAPGLGSGSRGEAGFARDAERKMKRREYKEAAPPDGTFDDLRDMAGGDGPG